ncbi:hypothetical protein [Serratia bockelmannii]|uniref:hypothetical protein n=1 Tax=Serratia bockelmannii TaxID=2703793 RepID=UPI003FA6FE28
MNTKTPNIISQQDIALSPPTKSIVVLVDAGSLLAGSMTKNIDGETLFVLSSDIKNPTTELAEGYDLSNYFTSTYSVHDTGSVFTKKQYDGSKLPGYLGNTSTIRWCFLSTSAQAYEKVLPYKLTISDTNARNVRKLDINNAYWVNNYAVNKVTSPADVPRNDTLLSYYDTEIAGIGSEGAEYKFTWSLALIAKGSPSNATKGPTQDVRYISITQPVQFFA